MFQNKRIRLGLLSTSHLANDFLYNIYIAILPLLHIWYGLSYTQMSTIVLFHGLVGGFLQPLLATFSDRREKPWFIPLGFFLLGAGMFIIYLSDQFILLLVAVLLASFGSAAFHPDANRCVHRLPGKNRGSIQSVFQIGGNSGMALAPVSLWFLTQTGTDGTIWLGMIAILFSLFFLFFTMKTETGHAPLKKKGAQGGKPPIHPGIVALVAVVASRSIANTGILTFLPLYYIATYGLSTDEVWVFTFLLLSGGALGTIAGGPLGDRFGMRHVTQYSLVLSTPLALLLPWISGVAAMICLFLLGLVMMSTFSVSVVYAQELMPERAGLASSLVIGLTGGIAGIVQLMLGVAADSYGLFPILCAIVLMPAVGAILCFFLPKTERLTVELDHVVK
ncbi:MFS transporter [Brevibacillus daliensis]|uniref:MFS transporter n=1 Tax=Brevibacillus daliensis TaxID=2892995 RepID=UPI001E34DE4C|nr:MFS transporter [Brevibacillus daliensis]